MAPAASKPSLETLPPELRLKIYKHLILIQHSALREFHRTSYLPSSDPFETSDFKSTVETNTTVSAVIPWTLSLHRLRPPPLSRVTRYLRAEYLPVYFANINIEIDLSWPTLARPLTLGTWPSVQSTHIFHPFSASSVLGQKDCSIATQYLDSLQPEGPNGRLTPPHRAKKPNPGPQPQPGVFIRHLVFRFLDTDATGYPLGARLIVDFNSRCARAYEITFERFLGMPLPLDPEANAGSDSNDNDDDGWLPDFGDWEWGAQELFEKREQERQLTRLARRVLSPTAGFVAVLKDMCAKSTAEGRFEVLDWEAVKVLCQALCMDADGVDGPDEAQRAWARKTIGGASWGVKVTLG